MTDNLIQNSITQFPLVFPDASVSEAGLIILGFHFDRFISNQAGTILGDDIEALHDMRVASRRLRVAVGLFGQYYDKKVIRRISKGLTKTGKNLGRVRDFDVLIEKMDHFLEDLPQEDIVDLVLFKDYLNSKRNICREKMLKFFQRKKYRKFTNQFDNFLNTGKNAGIFPEPVNDGSKTSYQIIKNKIDTVISRGSTLERPTITQLHKLRIAFKQLRYSIEFFGNSIGEQTSECVDLLKIIQDHLGEINDINLILIELEVFIQDRLIMEGLGWELQNYQNVDKFRTKRQAELTTLVSQFPVIWKEFTRKPFMKILFPEI